MLEVEIIILLVMIIINNDVRTPMMQGVASHTQGGDALEATTERGSPGLVILPTMMVTHSMTMMI